SADKIMSRKRPPKERRRRSAVPLTGDNPDKPQLPYSRRESDREKAHVYRWIELGEAALPPDEKPKDKAA
ncbi:MAG: hypothetical protein DMG73_02275, partial [Acidobacteria bacterium]